MKVPDPLLDKVYRYRSPAGMRHPGRRIARGREEVEVITSGRGRFHLRSGEVREVGAGGMLWYFSGEPIEVTADRRDPYECVVFSFRVSTGRQRRVRRLSFWSEPAEAQRFVRNALERFHPGMPGLAVFSRYCDARMRWELFESERRGELPERSGQDALEGALRWIDAHFREPIEVGAIASAAGVSEPQLYRLIRSRFGESPMRRVIRLRIQQARDLLTSTDLAIKAVGYESGFPDHVHFGRTFREQTGYTPGEYRKLFGR